MGHLAVQLAGVWGAKIITTVNTSEEFNYLQDLHTKIGTNVNVCIVPAPALDCAFMLSADRVVNLSSEKLKDVVMEETGMLGVNVILDNPSPAASLHPPTRAELISCLAVHGTLILSTPIQVCFENCSPL